MQLSTSALGLGRVKTLLQKREGLSTSGDAAKCDHFGDDGQSGPKISGIALGDIWPVPGFISLLNGRHDFRKLRAAAWSW
jgi:hypothetical protein